MRWTPDLRGWRRSVLVGTLSWRNGNRRSSGAARGRPELPASLLRLNGANLVETCRTMLSVGERQVLYPAKTAWVRHRRWAMPTVHLCYGKALDESQPSSASRCQANLT